MTALGAQVRQIGKVAYPYQNKTDNLSKECRYSKLHIFNQTDYSKIVYLDADTLVTQPIDEMFAFPSISAVSDIGGTFNTGVMVIEPGRKLFDEMMKSHQTAPSYNMGDQGFLNWFFNFTAEYSLPHVYNAPAKLKEYNMGSRVISAAKVLHYTSNTKPWNFYRAHRKDWTKNYHPSMYWKYQQQNRQVEKELGLGVWDSQSDFTSWDAKERMEKICASYMPKHEDYGSFPVQDKFSVAITVTDAPRLGDQIKEILTSKQVAHVYLRGKPTTHLKELVEMHPKVTIAAVEDTLNAHFAPLRGIRTQAVYVTTDYDTATASDLEFAFNSWKSRPAVFHGFHPLSHASATEYSMLATDGVMMNTDYLYMYSCLIPHEVHAYVDSVGDCHDVAINMMAAGATDGTPVLLQTKKSAPSVTPVKRSCIANLGNSVWTSNPLRLTSEIVHKVAFHHENTAVSTLSTDILARREDFIADIPKEVHQSLSRKVYELTNTTGIRKEDEICMAETQVSGEISALIVSSNKDLPAFRRLQHSLMTYGNTSEIQLVIVVPSQDMAGFAKAVTYPNAVLLTDDDVVPGIGELDFSNYAVLKGSRLVSREGWMRQQLVKLGAHRVVRTEHYVILDSDNLALTPMGFKDFVPDGQRSLTNIGKDMRRIGQFGRWWTWAVDALGASIEQPEFGVTPAIFSRTIVASMLDFIEHRYRGAWARVLVEQVNEWTEYGLYYTFAETSGLFDEFHVACTGRLYSYVLWAKYDWDSFDLELLFKQSHSLFSIVQSIKNLPSDAIDMIVYPHIDAQSPRLSRAESREKMYAAIDTMEEKVGVSVDPYAGYSPIVARRPTQAYVTFVTTDDYALAALSMGYSIRLTGSYRTLHCLVADGISDTAIQALSQVFDSVERVPALSNPNVEADFRAKMLPDLISLFPKWVHNGYHAELFTKLRVFNMTQYSKAIYVDADILMLKNIDELFGRPSLTAVADMMPPDIFNSGLMVIEPDDRMLADMLKKMHKLPSYNGGDQGFLNAYFPTWNSLSSTFRLPYYYNLQTKLRTFTKTAWVREARKAKLVHYSPTKPWRDVKCEDEKYKDLHRLWWKAFGMMWDTLSDQGKVKVEALLSASGIENYQQLRSKHGYEKKLDTDEILGI